VTRGLWFLAGVVTCVSWESPHEIIVAADDGLVRLAVGWAVAGRGCLCLHPPPSLVSDPCWHAFQVRRIPLGPTRRLQNMRTTAVHRGCAWVWVTLHSARRLTETRGLLVATAGFFWRSGESDVGRQSQHVFLF
jgi:hypothetical protein